MNADAPPCTLLPGGRGGLEQAALFAISALVLVVKKFREGPQRTWIELLLDTSKQFIGAFWAYLLTVVFATIQHAVILDDSCAWCWMNIMLGSTFGVFVEYVLLNNISFMLEKTAAGDTRDYLTGEYKDSTGQLVPKMYAKQLGVWIGCVTGMKIIILLLTSCFSSFCIGFGHVVLCLISWNSALESDFVMVLTPVVMNAVQLWATDSFIQKGGMPFTSCWQGTKSGCWTFAGHSRVKLIEALDGTPRDLEAPLMPSGASGHSAAPRHDWHLGEREQLMPREVQQLVAERRALEEARVLEEAHKEIKALEEALSRQIQVASEDAVEKQSLKTTVRDLDEQLALLKEKLQAASSTEAELRDQMHQLATSTAAAPRADPTLSDAADAAAAARESPRQVPLTARSEESCTALAMLPTRGDEEIVLLSKRELALRTPDQVRLEAAQRGMILDRKLGALEVKLREIALRSAAIPGSESDTAAAAARAVAAPAPVRNLSRGANARPHLSSAHGAPSWTGDETHATEG